MLEFLAPKLAASGRPRSLHGWTVEPKLDGWRAQVAVDRDGLVVRTRHGRDITAKVSSLAPFAGLGVECA